MSEVRSAGDDFDDDDDDDIFRAAFSSRGNVAGNVVQSGKVKIEGDDKKSTESQTQGNNILIRLKTKFNLKNRIDKPYPSLF